MQNVFDLKNCLSIFNEVITKGKSCEEGYELEGIKAWHDFDGYTCYLSYQQVTLTLMFHGKYHVDFSDKDDLAAFEQKLLRFKLK